jgi:hypothetical protein
MTTGPKAPVRIFTAPMAETPSDGTFSLKDLDQILEKEDPGFSASLEDIKKTAIEDASAIEALAAETTDEDELETSGSLNGDGVGPGSETTDPRAQATFRMLVRRAVGFLLTPVRWLRGFVVIRARKAKYVLVLFKNRSIDFIRHELPERIKHLFSVLRGSFTTFGKALARFWARPLKERLAFSAISVCVLTAVGFLVLSLRSHWLPQWQSPFVTSLVEEGEDLGTYVKVDEFIPLFEAFPEAEFHIRLEKVVVNLRADSSSGRLPMGLFEFFVGVDSRDTGVEIRDREKEVLDVIQRTLEGFTYSEVMSKAGKIQLKGRIRENLNAILNQGQVLNVYINRIVTNH